MNRTSTGSKELPDYLEVGTEEVYEDPGSTLPQDEYPPPADDTQPLSTQHPTSPSGNFDAGDTLPPELADRPSPDTVRDTAKLGAPDTHRQASAQAIVAGQRRSGRLQRDGPQPKRVLVVDDDLTARLYLRSRLMLRGNVHIFEASNAAEGVALLQSLHAVDAALLDVDMGVQNGFELCKAIRAWVRSQGGKQPKIYMITSRTSMLDKMRAKMAGADAFLSKPPLPKELALLLAQL